MRARGSGTTTRQIQSLRVGGVFVWCNDHTEYPTKVAAAVGRDDVQIKPLSWLIQGLYRGINYTDYDIDHATIRSKRINEHSENALTRVRTPKESPQ